MENLESGLSRRALLVAVNISSWAGRKLDRQATNSANTIHKASASAGSYHKKLLPESKELAKISAISSAARSYFYENSLPWLCDGTRIISAKNYLNFAKEIVKIKSEYEKAVSEFIAVYPQLKKDAESKLGELYKLNEYPDSIADKFSFEINYLPMPDVSDFRIDVSETEKNEFKRKILEVEHVAMRDAWSRIHSVIKNAAEKLASGAMFRDSLIENITEMTAILPMLNISDSDDMNQAMQEINSVVSKIIPGTLRENKHERQDAAAKLAEIEKSLSAYIGVKI